MDLIQQLPSIISRFKFCWLPDTDEKPAIAELRERNIPIINISRMLASTIDPPIPSIDLSLQVTKYFSGLLEDHATEISGYDAPVVAIQNIGIIQEPKLNLNFEKSLQDVCRSICVILIWDGKYKDGEFIQESDLNSQVYLSFSQPLIELSI